MSSKIKIIMKELEKEVIFMNMNKKINIILLITLLFTLLATSSYATELSLGHLTPVTSIQHHALVKFAEIVKEKTEGDIEINIFPSAQLGSGSDEVDAVAMGIQEMFAGGLTWWTQHSERMRLVEVPFIWENREHFENWVNNVMATKVQSELINKSNQRFINLGVLWKRGPYRVLLNSKRPVIKVEDLKGLRLRMWEADLPQRVWNMMGAVSTTLPWGDAYLAIKQGLVDAVTSPMDSVWGFKFTEVAQYVTELDQFPQIMGMVINEEIWNKMNEKQQKAIMSAADEAGTWYNNQLSTQIQEDKQKMIKNDNAVFIQMNNKSFMDKAGDEIFPKLVEEGQIDKELYNEMRQYIVD